MPDSVVHSYVKTMVGAGGLVEGTNFNHYRRDMNQDYNASAFFVAEAETGVEINLTRWCKLVPYGGYRLVSGNINQSGITDGKLCGFNFGLKAEFGWF